MFQSQIQSGTQAHSKESYTNNLINQTSPYLLQHAHNPVDWYPWGEEAFKAAKEQDKPIFLSIGYSTCHWCHVMEKESFESVETAKLLNEHFISIKVDREERPDVDKVYMTFIQALTGGGGWPLSVFLTPELKPMTGGTYFPNVQKFGTPAFSFVLEKIAQYWREQKEKARNEADGIMKQLQGALTEQPKGVEQVQQEELLSLVEVCAHSLSKNFNIRNGGFSPGPPFFPTPCQIQLMFREAYRQYYLDGVELKPLSKSTPEGMALFSLTKMSQGGIHDHVGGGFHRYSVDEFWHVPHFEKMLYDNAQLASSYLEASQITNDVYFSLMARDILDYLMRGMTSKEGGVFSAEDADSYDAEKKEKTEGSFYVWEYPEIMDILKDAKMFQNFSDFYNVKMEGNCNRSQSSDPHREFISKNCLYTEKRLDEYALDKYDQMNASLSKAREQVYQAREMRARPERDDKIIAAWNGMILSAFAKASRVLSKSEYVKVQKSFPVEGHDPEKYLNSAIGIGENIMRNLWDKKNNVLLRSYLGKPSYVQAFADDYAQVIQGMLDLYECSGQIKWFAFALKLQKKMDQLFWDSNSGGYYNNSGADPSVLLRMKEDYDGAEPAASSVAISNLKRIASFFGDSSDYSKELITRANDTMHCFAPKMKRIAMAMPQLCASAYLLAMPSLRQIIVVGSKSSAQTEELLDSIHQIFCPEKVVITIDPQDQEALTFWKDNNQEVLTLIDLQKEEPLVYICQNFTCQRPTNDIKKIQEYLKQNPFQTPTLKQQLL